MKSGPTPAEIPVSLVYNGQLYKGTYRTDRSMLVVTYGVRREVIPLGNDDPEALAREMLRYMISLPQRTVPTVH